MLGWTLGGGYASGVMCSTIGAGALLSKANSLPQGYGDLDPIRRSWQ